MKKLWALEKYLTTAFMRFGVQDCIGNIATEGLSMFRPGKSAGIVLICKSNNSNSCQGNIFRPVGKGWGDQVGSIKPPFRQELSLVMVYKLLINY